MCIFLTTECLLVDNGNHNNYTCYFRLFEFSFFFLHLEHLNNFIFGCRHFIKKVKHKFEIQQ